MPACRRDGDFRDGLSCEALPNQPPAHGEYICWQSGPLGKGLGLSCTKDGECMSQLCLAHPTTGTKVCSAPCGDLAPCKDGHACVGGSRFTQ